MKQMSFADAEYAGKRKQTRRGRFLIKMDQVVPCKDLVTLIEPHYPRAGGRPEYPLMVMLRVYLMQNCLATAIRRWKKHCMKRRFCGSSRG